MRKNKSVTQVLAGTLALSALAATAADAPTPTATFGAKNAHALIMTIGQYQGNIPKLQGVAKDTETAREIAQRMGVPAANIVTLRDGELTKQGMQAALDQLENRLGGDDQVFIYYSGHGGRQLVQENGVERCAESLITADGQGLTDTELETRLNRVAQKSQKIVVFLDACHSGGVTTRAAGTSAPAFTPKSWNGSTQNCSKPTNVLTRSLAQAKSPGTGRGNFVHIAAAREDEVALDQPGRGGLASLAWLSCMSGAARDADASGALSATEIRDCAQQKIAEQLKNVQGYLPHHVTLTGNAAMVLSYKEAPPAPAPASPTPAAAAATAAPPAPAAVVAASPLAALQDIYNSRDDRRLTTLTAEKTTLRIGRDELNFTLHSREGGYAYLLMVGSDGKTFDLLFPNQLDRDHQLAPGASLRLPRPAWQLSAGGPAGRNTLLAIVSDRPRNFAAAGLVPSGPFSAASAAAAKDIQLVTVGADQPDQAECANPSATRSLVVRKRCSSGYGAAMLTIEEVD